MTAVGEPVKAPRSAALIDHVKWPTVIKLAGSGASSGDHAQTRPARSARCPNRANNDRSAGLVRPIQADAGGELYAVGAL